MAGVGELKSEANIQNQILIALSQAGCLVWRQDTGAYKDPKSGRLVRYGLCKGSSDVIGAIPVEITHDMVGKKVAIFGAWEVKTATGRIRPEQLQFIAAVKKAGGRAGVARGVEDALDIARGAV